MTAEKLREAVNATPFRKFRVHVGGGRMVEVGRPELIMISPSGRTAAIYGRRDKLEIIDVFMVQSIEFGNGAIRRGR